MSYTASYIVNSSSAQGTTDFQFTFPYIKEEHIEVYLNYSKLTQGSGSTQYQVITNVSPKLIRLNTGIASANLRVEVRRNSSLGTPLVDYADGSTLTANDLDTSALQSLYIDQELKDNQSRTVVVDETTGLPELNSQKLTNVADPTAAQDAATKNYVDTKQFASAQIVDGTIVNADINASAAIDGTKISPNFGSQNIVTSGTVDGRDVSADGSKLDGIETGATADQTNAEIRAAVEAASDSNVFTDADHSKLNAIEAGATADQTNAEIRAAVEAASDSNVFTDADHTKLNAIEANATADQTNAEIRAAVEAATDSNVFTDADHTKLNGIETAATADQTAAEIKTAYESNAQTNPLTDAEKAVIDGVTANTSELNKLDGVTASTAELNIVAGKSFKTSSGTLDTTSDTEIPSAKVIAAHVASSQTAIGGFVTIADEVSFPTTANMPANGVVVSINNAAGVVVNGSGVSTTGRTTDGTPATVTINGFPSSLNGETLAAGVGLMVTATSTSNTYSYHKILAAETDVKQLSDDINDFNARYRVASSAPGSSNDAGDMYFDTSANKMKVYNGTTNAWDDVASVGSFYVNTISSSSSTGGGSATFNGSAYRFTLSNPGTSAQQHIVSINGVIQKPNSGTSQPSEGFALSGNDIIFSAAPASGSDFFIVTSGSSVSIGTPSANSVNSSHIIDGSIVNGDISNSANIAGSKLADDSIPEVKLDIHNAPATGKYLKHTSNGMEWADGASEGTDVKSTGESGGTKFLREDGDGTSSWQSVPAGVGGANGVDFNDNVKARFGTGNDLEIFHSSTNTSNSISCSGGQLDIRNTNGSLDLRGNIVYVKAHDGSANFITCTHAGAVDIYHSGSKKLETTSSGINVTGSININGSALSTAPQFQATASGAITAGKPVIINSNGTVTQVGQSYSEKSTPASGSFSNPAGSSNLEESGIAWHKHTGKAVVWYTNQSDSTRGYIGFGTLNSDGDAFSSFPVGRPDGTNNGGNITCISPDPDSNFCLFSAYNNQSKGYVKWFDTSQSSPDGTNSTGGHTQVTTGQMVSAWISYDTSADKWILAYRDGNESNKSYVRTVTKSGTSLSLGTRQEIDGGRCDAMKMAYDPDNNKTLLVYSDQDNNNYLRAKVLTISGTDISLGSVQGIGSVNGSRKSLVYHEGINKFVLSYQRETSTQALKMRTVEISGTSVTWGSTVDVCTGNSGYNSLNYDPNLDKILIFYRKRNSNTYGDFRSASISGTTITLGTEFPDQNGSDTGPTNEQITYLSTAFDITKNRWIYSYLDEGSDIQIRPIEYSEVTTNVTAGNFIGLAAAAASDTATATIDVTGATNTGVSGLTVGEEYYVSGDGTLSTTGTIFAGKAVAANKLIVDYLKPSGGYGSVIEEWHVRSGNTGDLRPTGSTYVSNRSSGNANWPDANMGKPVLIGLWAGSSGVTWGGTNNQEVTFPSTGKWQIEFNGYTGNSSQELTILIECTQNNSSWIEGKKTKAQQNHNSRELGLYVNFKFDVTNTSTHKVRIKMQGNNSSNATISAMNGTNIQNSVDNSLTFTKIG